MKRPYFKLSFGPNFVGWFDNQEACHAAMPRLVYQLRRLGVIRFVKQKRTVWPFDEFEVLAEKPTHELLVEAIELTPEAYHVYASTNPKWVTD